MSQDTLSRRISGGKKLTPREVEELAEVFGKGCQAHTKVAVVRALELIPLCRGNVGIFGRVHLENGGGSYCAGQSYPDEVRTVRQCLIGRR